MARAPKEGNRAIDQMEASRPQETGNSAVEGTPGDPEKAIEELKRAHARALKAKEHVISELKAAYLNALRVQPATEKKDDVSSKKEAELDQLKGAYAKEVKEKDTAIRRLAQDTEGVLQKKEAELDAIAGQLEDSKLEQERLAVRLVEFDETRREEHETKRRKRAVTQDLHTCLDMEADRLIRASGTEDFQEAVKAFVEKRQPVFRGR